MRRLVRNGLAASILVPWPLRVLIYRALGMRVAAWHVSPGCFFGDENVFIGPKTFVNYGCFFDTLATVTVGAHCHLAQQVMIVTSSHALDDARTLTARPVTVQDRCWIGARVMILPGVTVGEGCVVAAGAVVAHDCEPRGLYAGVPARRLRDLDGYAAPRPAVTA